MIQWVALSLVLLLATGVQAHELAPGTMRQALSDSLAQVGIRRSPQAAAFARHFATLANLSISKSPTSPTAISMAGIDATQGAIGPIYLTNPSTLPAGALNFNVLGGTGELDGLDGSSLDPTPEPGLLVLEQGDEPLAVAVSYHLSLRESAVGFAVTYGLSDTWNASVLLPIVSSNLAISARASNGEAGSVHLHHLGIGDLTLRVKHRLPDLFDIRSAVSLDVQLPTGDPEDLTGTGDYWVTPTLSARKILLDGMGDITANVGIDFDLSDSRQTQALYGIGTSWMLLPWLAGVVEFLGRSQLDSIQTAKDTDVFYLTPTGITKSPLFGFTFDRADYLDLAFGVRIILNPLVIILGGVYHLDNAGLHDKQIAPSVGIGATW
jgi:hypothetical protein